MLIRAEFYLQGMMFVDYEEDFLLSLDADIQVDPLRRGIEIEEAPPIIEGRPHHHNIEKGVILEVQYRKDLEFIQNLLMTEDQQGALKHLRILIH